MLFWNGAFKCLEVYFVADDRFYKLCGEPAERE